MTDGKVFKSKNVQDIDGRRPFAFVDNGIDSID